MEWHAAWPQIPAGLRRDVSVRTCLNAVTTGYPGSLRDWLAIAARHGFDGVEFPLGELAGLVEAQGAEAARQLQSASGVRLAVFGLPVNWQGSESAFRDGLRALERQVGAAATVGCSRAATFVPPNVPDGVSPALHALRCVRRLRSCCEVLGGHGIALAVEWVGTPSLRVGREPFLWTAEHAVELCDGIGLPNVGLLWDSWHWFTTGSSPADLDRVPATRIVHVHINDAPARPLAEQQDNVRLLPGASGQIDLVAVLQRLRAIGYDGYVAVETFSEELPRLGVDAAAARARAAIDAVWRQI